MESGRMSLKKDFNKKLSLLFIVTP